MKWYVCYDVASATTEALDFYDRGLPSALPGENRMKRSVEDHRWGKHYAGPVAGCPVCARQELASSGKGENDG